MKYSITFLKIKLFWKIQNSSEILLLRKAFVKPQFYLFWKFLKIVDTNFKIIGNFFNFFKKMQFSKNFRFFKNFKEILIFWRILIFSKKIQKLKFSKKNQFDIFLEINYYYSQVETALQLIINIFEWPQKASKLWVKIPQIILVQICLKWLHINMFS